MKFRLRRLLHWLLFIVAALTTLGVLFYAEENWRGARAWAAAKRDLQARGESLDLKDFIPPPIPDNQNLAMAPLFVRLFQYEVDPRTRLLTFNHGNDWYKSVTYKQMQDMPWGAATRDGRRPSGYGNWMSGHRSDLSVLQKYFRLHPDFPHAAQPQAPADDVLLALTRYAPQLAELSQAATERPQMRLPNNWTQRPAWGMSLPGYNFLQMLIATLRMRALAELADGQMAAARSDLALILRLRQGTERDPTLIAGLVDITSIGLLMQPVWEGLAARQWSADDLDALRDGLHGINVLREFQQAIRGGERAGFVSQWASELPDLAQARELARVMPLMGNHEVATNSQEYWLWKSLPYWPRGWFAQNAVVGSRYLQEYGVEIVDPDRHRVALAKAKSIDQALHQIPPGPGTMLARIALPVYAGLTRKFAQAQTIVDQAVTACALEKYFLDHHAYPSALAALVPAYLDRVRNDVIDGAPMRYRLTVDGRYQLYSVGWDGNDDGGAIVWPPDRKWRRAVVSATAAPEQNLPNPVTDQGDWVWQYAPAEPPDPPVNQSRLESLHP